MLLQVFCHMADKLQWFFQQHLFNAHISKRTLEILKGKMPKILLLFNLHLGMLTEPCYTLLLWMLVCPLLNVKFDLETTVHRDLLFGQYLLHLQTSQAASVESILSKCPLLIKQNTLQLALNKESSLSLLVVTRSGIVHVHID